ncbi:MAG: hypothetical protein AAF844_06220 [Pseudomonadota bacterium]
MPPVLALVLPPFLAVVLALACAIGMGVQITPKTGCTPATCGEGYGDDLRLSGAGPLEGTTTPR